MASRDYILCKYCKCKLVYDGYDSIREGLEQTYGTNQLVCPDCLKKLEEIIRESEQKLKQSPAVEQEKPINQCDGCQAGMQCIDGLHYHNDKPVMACTKRLYIGKTTPVECEPVFTWKTGPKNGVTVKQEDIKLLAQMAGILDCNDDVDLDDHIVLWVGETIGDDGEKTFGLAYYSEECPEEGSIGFIDLDKEKYLKPQQSIDEETRRMVLELCDLIRDNKRHIMLFSLQNRMTDIAKQLRERIRP